MRNQPSEASKEDLRQRRTKKLLTEALLSLMEEQPFSEISVVDICLRANPRSYFLSVFQSALSFVRTHNGLYRSAVSSGSVAIQTLEDLVAEQLLSRFPADETNPARAEITAHFYAGGFLAIVRWWLERGADLPEEALLPLMDQAGLFPELSSQQG